MCIRSLCFDRLHLIEQRHNKGDVVDSIEDKNPCQVSTQRCPRVVVLHPTDQIKYHWKEMGNCGYYRGDLEFYFFLTGKIGKFYLILCKKVALLLDGCLRSLNGESNEVDGEGQHGTDDQIGQYSKKPLQPFDFGR